MRIEESCLWALRNRITESEDNVPQLKRITLATTDTAAMAAFYNHIFGAELSPIAAYGTTLYKGSLGAVELLLCPNEIAAVIAEQNRHQLRFEVEDIDSLIQRVLEAGGTVDGEIAVDSHTGVRSVAVRDPDGN